MGEGEAGSFELFRLIYIIIMICKNSGGEAVFVSSIANTSCIFFNVTII